MVRETRALASWRTYARRHPLATVAGAGSLGLIAFRLIRSIGRKDARFARRSRLGRRLAAVLLRAVAGPAARYAIKRFLRALSQPEGKTGDSTSDAAGTRAEALGANEGASIPDAAQQQAPPSRP